MVVLNDKKSDNTGEDMEDLISIGTIGLIKAIESYRPKRNEARDFRGTLHRVGASANLLITRLDITDEEQVQASVQAAMEKFGRIDVLVNNAGYGQLGFFEETSEEQIRYQMETNVFGTMRLTRAVLPIMRNCD